MHSKLFFYRRCWCVFPSNAIPTLLQTQKTHRTICLSQNHRLHWSHRLLYGSKRCFPCEHCSKFNSLNFRHLLYNTWHSSNYWKTFAPPFDRTYLSLCVFRILLSFITIRDSSCISFPVSVDMKYGQKISIFFILIRYY